MGLAVMPCGRRRKEALPRARRAKRQGQTQRRRRGLSVDIRPKINPQPYSAALGLPLRKYPHPACGHPPYEPLTIETGWDDCVALFWADLRGERLRFPKSYQG